MFEIGWSELLLVGLVALLVLGPEEFPRALRTMGQWLKKIKETASSVQSQVQDAIKEVDITSDIKSTGSIMAESLPENPLKGVHIFSDDLAKSWNMEILANETPHVEVLNEIKPNEPKPKIRVKAKRGKRTKTEKTVLPIHNEASPINNEANR